MRIYTILLLVLLQCSLFGQAIDAEIILNNQVKVKGAIMFKKDFYRINQLKVKTTEGTEKNYSLSEIRQFSLTYPDGKQDVYEVYDIRIDTSSRRKEHYSLNPQPLWRTQRSALKLMYAGSYHLLSFPLEGSYHLFLGKAGETPEELVYKPFVRQNTGKIHNNNTYQQQLSKALSGCIDTTGRMPDQLNINQIIRLLKAYDRCRQVSNQTYYSRKMPSPQFGITTGISLNKVYIDQFDPFLPIPVPFGAPVYDSKFTPDIPIGLQLELFPFARRRQFGVQAEVMSGTVRLKYRYPDNGFNRVYVFTDNSYYLRSNLIFKWGSNDLKKRRIYGGLGLSYSTQIGKRDVFTERLAANGYTPTSYAIKVERKVNELSNLIVLGWQKGRTGLELRGDYIYKSSFIAGSFTAPLRTRSVSLMTYWRLGKPGVWR